MSKDFFIKYVPLTLLLTFERVIQGLRVRGSWRPNRNFHILTSTLMAGNVVSFSFSWCSTGGPEAHSAGCWLSLLLLSATSLDPNSMGAPSPFGLVWLSLPHLVYNSVRSPTATSSSFVPLSDRRSLPTSKTLCLVSRQNRQRKRTTYIVSQYE